MWHYASVHVLTSLMSYEPYMSNGIDICRLRDEVSSGASSASNIHQSARAGD